jgi:hypothetical protein
MCLRPRAQRGEFGSETISTQDALNHILLKRRLS